MGVDGRSKSIDVVHAAEVIVGLGLQTLNVNQLADVAEVEAVDHSAAESGCITNRDALVVIALDLPGGLPGKLLAAVAGDSIGELTKLRSAERSLSIMPRLKQAVVAIPGEVVVELQDIVVQTRGQWRRKRKTLKVSPSPTVIVLGWGYRLKMELWLEFGLPWR